MSTEGSASGSESGHESEEVEAPEGEEESGGQELEEEENVEVSTSILYTCPILRRVGDADCRAKYSDQGTGW